MKSFSLRSLLIIVAIAAVTIAIVNRPKNLVVQAIERIYAAGGYDFKFSEMEFADKRSIQKLKPLIDGLNGPIPSDLNEYVQNCIPQTSTDLGPILFTDVDDILADSTESIPDIAVIPLGFFIFAREGDGSAFAHCIHDNRIYHLGFINEGDIDPTTEAVIAAAWESWPNFVAFIEDRTLQVIDE